MSDWMSRYRIFEEQSEGMHPEMTLDDFNYTIYISPKYNYAYAFTPKAGCTTLKKLLTDAEVGKIHSLEDIEYLHYREFFPFLKTIQIGDPRAFFQREDIFKFCFVRHPYGRLLSGYLDKVVHRKGQHQQIEAALGKQEGENISFAEFIDAVVQLPIIEQDQHWRVQYYQTYQAGIKHDFIGRFENFAEDVRYVAERLGIQAYLGPEILGTSLVKSVGRHHATGADALVEQYYTPDLKAKIYEKYRMDFEVFGYQP